jgi:glycosyltransferase involved in cell wall biosynthesis
MEAFASGLPVVGTDIEGTNELVEDGATGLLAPPADSAALAAKIAECMDHYDESLTMAEKARTKLEKSHAPELIHKRYMRFYEKLMEKPGKEDAARRK